MRAAIIGGGASGLCAACYLAMHGAQVVVLEKQDRVGRKLLATGNGRCNILNMHVDLRSWHGDTDAAWQVLHENAAKDVRTFFSSIGLETVEEDEGRVYPVSRQAAAVLDALRLMIPLYGGEIRTNARVTAIQPMGKQRFRLTMEDGDALTADRVLVAAGGLAAPKLGGCADGVRLLESLGHTSTKRFPAIAALKTEPSLVRAIKGQRVHGTISAISEGRVLREEAGEILFADGSISGIAAMQLARCCQEAIARSKSVEVRIRACDLTQDIFLKRANLLKGFLMEDLLTGLVPKRIGMELVKSTGIDLHATVDSLREDELKSLWRITQQWTFPITGVMGYEQAQVTAGGIRLKEFDPETLQSRRVPGLYAAGEVLNIDGDCGGYNLLWAWASALTVARAMMDK